MATRKPQQGDKASTDPTHPVLRDNHLDLVDVNDDAVDSFQFFDPVSPFFRSATSGELCEIPQSSSQEVSFSDFGKMNDSLPQPNFDLDGFEDIDLSCFDGIANDFPRHDAFQDLTVAEMTDHRPASGLANFEFDGVPGINGEAAGALKIRRGSGERNNAASLFGNPVIYGRNAPVSGHYLTNGALGLGNTFMKSAPQSDTPQMLDGRSLTLAVNMDPGSRFDISSGYRSHVTERAAISQPNMTSIQRGDGNSVNPCSNNLGGFSSFQGNAGDFIGPAQNHSGFSSQAQDFDGFSGLQKNTDGFPCQGQNVNEFCSEVQAVRGFPGPLQNVGWFSHRDQNADRCSGMVQNAGGFSRLSPNDGVPLVDQRQYSNIAGNWNLGLADNRNATYASVQSNTAYQQFPAGSSLPNYYMGLPRYDQHNPTGLLSCSSASQGIQASSNWLQNSQTGINGTFSPEVPLVSPFSRIAMDVSKHVRSGFHGQSQASLQVQPSKSIPGPAYTSGKEVPATNVLIQASGVPLRPSLKSCTTELASPANQAQGRKTGITKSSCHLSTPNVAPIAQPLAQTTPITPPGQGVQGVHGVNGPAQASRVARKQPLKRAATGLPPPTPRAQRRKTRSTNSSHLSTANVSQTSPPSAQATSFSTPIVQPASAHRLPHQTASLERLHSLLGKAAYRHQSPTQTALFSSLPKTDSAAHIRWQDPDKSPKLSGKQCWICKRDLSYTPEGPAYQPADPPPVAVLPCDHYFHSYCLERITPQDQADEPQCIPCALGDKN